MSHSTIVLYILYVLFTSACIFFSVLLRIGFLQYSVGTTEHLQSGYAGSSPFECFHARISLTSTVLSGYVCWSD